MRYFLLILLLSLVAADEDGPSSECKSNPADCTVDDFKYKVTEAQCLYTNYDRRFEPWKLPINGTFREDCPFWFACTPFPRDKNILEYVRDVKIGNDKDTVSSIKQHAMVYDTVPEAVRAHAVLYYDRDTCQVGLVTIIILVVAAVLVCAGCAYGVSEFADRLNKANKMEELIEYGIVDEPATGYKRRNKRIF